MSAEDPLPIGCLDCGRGEPLAFQFDAAIAPMMQTGKIRVTLECLGCSRRRVLEQTLALSGISWSEKGPPSSTMN